MFKYMVPLLTVAVAVFATTGFLAIQSPGVGNSPFTPATSSDVNFTENVFIYPNGTVSDPAAVVLSNGVYTLQGNINGTLHIEKSSTTLNGSGYNLNGKGGSSLIVQNLTDIALSHFSAGNGTFGIQISNTSHFSASDLNISMPGGYAVYLANTSNGQLTNDNFSGSQVGAAVLGSQNIGIMHTNISGSGKISVLVGYSSNVNISNDMFNNGAGRADGVQLIMDPTPVYMYGDTFVMKSGNATNITGNTMGLVLKDSSITANTGVRSVGSTSMAMISGSTFNLTENSIHQFGEMALFSGGFNTNITVNGNNVFSNTTQANGLIVNSGSGNNITLTGNTFTKIRQSFVGDSGFGSNVIASGNRIVGSVYSMAFEWINTLTLTNNTFHNVSDLAVGVLPGVKDLISGNTFVNVTTAVQASDLNSGFLASSNSVNDARNGFLIASASSGQIFGNTENNVSYPLNVTFSTGLQIFGNQFNNSVDGIVAANDLNTAFFNNVVTNVSGNAFISSSTVNVSVYGNTLSNVTGDMLNMTMNTGEVIYHNNFENGSVVKVILTENVNLSWSLSLPVGGNYWSNYTHNGQGSTGIGAYPYNISSGNHDEFPLTAPWASTSITFVENGLAAGTVWSVTIGGSTLSSTASSIKYFPNAAQHVSMAYAFSAVSGYTLSKSTGSLTISGSSQTVDVSYTQIPQATFSVNFTETGLPLGASWTVMINGVSHSSNTSSIMVVLAPGTYYVTVIDISGYSVVAPNNVSISNANLSENVTFTGTPATSGSGNAALTATLVAVGVAGGVVAGILGYMLYSGTGVFSGFRKGKKN